METTEVKKTEIVKSRSVWECMSDGLSAAFEYMGASLRGLWPMVILFSLVAPIVYLKWAGMLTEQLLDGTVNAALMTHEKQAILKVLSASTLPLVLGLMDAFLNGGIIWRQRQLTAMGFIPHTPAWREWRGIGSMTLRVVVTGFLALLFYLLIVALCFFMLMGLFSVVRHWAVATGLSIVMFIVVFILYVCVVFYLIGVFLHMTMPYLYEDVSLRRSVASAKWTAYPVACTFSVALVAFVASCFFGLAFVLPGVVIQIVDFLSVKSTAMGDHASLPSSLSLWRYLAMVLMFFGSFVCNVVILFPILYRWGAMKSEESKPTPTTTEEIS